MINKPTKTYWNEDEPYLITVDSLMEHYENRQLPLILYKPKNKRYKVISFKMYKRDDGSWKSVVGYVEMGDSKCRKVEFYRSIEQLQDKFELVLD